MGTGFLERPIVKRLLTPWGIALIILGIFFLGEAYLALRDRPVDQAIESDPAFAAPAMDFAFSRKFPWDPLAFVGRGAHAGLWNWTPDGLVLTDKGRQFFNQSGDMFVSHASAGKRKIVRIRTNRPTASGDRQIGFIYRWAEVSPPAAALLIPPPRESEEYPGEAIVTRESGAWKVKSLSTQDFDVSMARLKESVRRATK